MKMKGLLICLLMLLAMTLKTQAATYSAYLPGGKNYINPENFRLRNDTIESIEHFKVLANQTYTLTYPGDDMFFDSHLTIGGKSGNTYADGIAMDLSQCDVDQYLAVCTFTTSSNEDGLYVRIRSMGAERFYNHYGLGDIQLEEGSVSTSHADYVAPAIDMEEPSFSASGGFVQSYVDQTPIQTILENHISVVDEIDGDLSDQIVIESDAYTANSDKVGSYLVTLSATDSSGNKASFDLTIIVKDEVVPIISGPSSLDLSVDQNQSLEELLSTHYSIYDAYDGPLSYQVISDNYSVNKNKIGDYDVSISTEDSSGNQTSKSIQISVSDQQAPTISGVDELTSFMSNPLSIEDILATQTVQDNYTSLQLSDLTISDGFTSKEMVVGVHEIDLSLMDGSGNQTSKTLRIRVEDDVKPSISGPITYVDSYKKNIGIEDLKALLSVSDNVDTIDMSQVVVLEDTLTTRSQQVGEFIVSFQIEDQSGNLATHTINVTLLDDIPPVIYVDSYIINVSSGTSFTNKDALRLMLSSKELLPGEYKMDTLVNEYQGNEEKPGNYLYKVSFTSEEGEVLEKEFIIKVEEDTNGFRDFVNFRRLVIYGLSFGLLGLIVYKVKK